MSTEKTPNPYSEARGLAEEKHRKNPERYKSVDAAMSAVFDERPDLWARYRAQDGRPSTTVLDDGPDAYSEARALATQKFQADSTKFKSVDAAMATVWAEHPELWARYRAQEDARQGSADVHVQEVAAASGGTDDAYSEARALAEEKHRKEPQRFKSADAAMSTVFEERPELWARYRGLAVVVPISEHRAPAPSASAPQVQRSADGRLVLVGHRHAVVRDATGYWLTSPVEAGAELPRDLVRCGPFTTMFEAEAAWQKGIRWQECSAWNGLRASGALASVLGAGSTLPPAA